MTTKRFEDPAAEFVPAVECVFGVTPRVLDGSRAVDGDIEQALHEAKELLPDV